jgi:adenylylsulfate kinase
MRREQQNGHRAGVVWFTGLSGSGKSTLAHAVEEELHQLGCRTFVLDVYMRLSRAFVAAR